jgi:phosphoribosylanthranilate isomerase
VTPLVKICGLTDITAVTAAVEAGADAIGFVFADSVRRISVQDAIELATYVPKHVRKVAVMMHPSNEEWQEVNNGFQPGVLQTDLADFAYLEVPGEVEIWPVMREGTVPADNDLPELFVYEGKASGSGETVDWQVAAQLARRGRMILAGGLSIANVPDAVREVAPFGIDVSSGVESAPGIKDATRIQAFINAVRTAGSATEEVNV